MRKWILMGLVVGLVPTFGCAESMDGLQEPSVREGTAGIPSVTTTARGALVADAGASVSVAGHVIVGSFLTPDGEFVEVDGAQADSAADGTYQFNLDGRLEPGLMLVVRAFDGDDLLGSVAVPCGGEHGGVIEIPPIEIDVDVDVDVEVDVDAGSDGGCSTCPGTEDPAGDDGTGDEPGSDDGSGDDGTGDDGAGDDGSGNDGSGNDGSGNGGSGDDGAGDDGAGDDAPCATCQGTLADLVISIEAAIAACEDILSGNTIGAGAKVAVAQTAIATARAQLDAELAVATTALEVEAAFQAYLQACIAAYLNAGITTKQLTIAIHAVVDARDLLDVSLTAEVCAALLSQIELVRASLVITTIEGVFAGDADALAAIAVAAGDLRVDLAAAAGAGVNAGADIHAAWTAFSVSVRAALDAHLRATLIAGLGLNVIGVDIAQLCANVFAVIDIAASVTTSATDCVAAVADLHAKVFAQANVDALVAEGLTTAQAHAALTVIFHITAATELSAE